MVSRRRTMIAIAAGVLGFALTLSLGNWQTRRAEYKLALQKQWDAAQRAGPIAIASAATLQDVPARVPLRVRLTGRFEHRYTVWLENRPMQGRVGFFVITPLVTPAGVVLVNRGWVERDPLERRRLPAIDSPAGEVTIEGLAVGAAPRLLELGEDDVSDHWPHVWQNLDYDNYERASGLKVARIVVEQTLPAEDALRRDWPAPDFGIEMHRGYAVQWYSLAVLIAGLTVYFGWRALRREAR